MLSKLVRKDKYTIINSIEIKFRKFKLKLFDKFFFYEVGENVYIGKPLYITPKCISIGSNVSIWKQCRIEGVYRYNNIDFMPNIIIDEGVSIQQNLHLTCANKIHIGKNTAIASNVTITDINHPYTDINQAIEKQDIEVSSVEIGENCKIYNNSIILPGVKIGRHCVIAANSVVNIDIPDYSVVAGIPARIIKRYNISSNKWEVVK